MESIQSIATAKALRKQEEQERQEDALNPREGDFAALVKLSCRRCYDGEYLLTHETCHLCGRTGV
jgi:hypothetical protein